MALELEHFDVKAMIDELIDTVGSLVQKNRNTFTVHCSADAGTMHGDLTKTRQILLNLLSNAGKFTTNGTVTVDVRQRRERRRAVHRVQRDGHRRRHDRRAGRARSSSRSRRPT